MAAPENFQFTPGFWSMTITTREVIYTLSDRIPTPKGRDANQYDYFLLPEELRPWKIVIVHHSNVIIHEEAETDL